MFGSQPDLRVTDITLSAAHNPPQEGDAITLAAVVNNSGTAATGATSYGVLFQVDGSQVATGTSSARERILATAYDLFSRRGVRDGTGGSAAARRPAPRLRGWLPSS